MDIFLIILGSICLLVGLAGCIVPMLPGPPVSYLALVFLHFTDKVSFTIPQLFFWLFIVVLIQILDYFIPMFGVKRLGGTPWGKWGCIIGTFASIFLFAPWGVFIGPFVGAVVGELLGGKETKYALKAGFGAFAGFLLGTVLKVAVCGWFIFCFIRALV